MTETDSPIIDFYPTKLQYDPNGKKFSWQWVVLLPFIDEERLLRAVNSVKVPLCEPRRVVRWRSVPLTFCIGVGA
jgi:5'-3' exonuclease